tara:strand:+ start:331 stop:804 length:474 start_codon:yes stop_codon:yes gene_type:complete
MKLQGALVLKGEFTIRHFRDGKLLSEEVLDNTVTNVGKADIAGLINGNRTDLFKWLALGDTSTAAAATNTASALSEITSGGLGRAAATPTQVTTTLSSDTAQAVKTFSATATKTVRGVGLFDTSTASGGTMASRVTFSDKNMESGDTLQITHKMKVA